MPDPVVPSAPPVASPLPPVSALRDPVAAQKALHADNQAYFSAMDGLAFSGSGNSSYWLNRTELTALRTLAFAARSTLHVGEGRNDPPAVQAGNAARIAEAARGIARTAERWRQGYGDAPYWFERAKGMGIECAGGAAVIASLCDDSLAAAIRPRLEQGLQAADDAQFGSGQAPYWSSRTAQEADAIRTTLGSLAPTPPAKTAGSAAPSALQNDLEALNRSLSADVSNLVFGKTGQARVWMYRAEHVAIRGEQEAARKEMRLAAEHVDGAAERAAHGTEIERAAADYRDAADGAASGTGDGNFWLDRNVAFAATTAVFAEKVAASCDAATIKAVQPLLEQAMTTTENNAFSGSGYAQFWMDKITGTTAAAKNLAEDVRIRSQAEAAAAAAEKAGSPPERRAAEMDLARQQAIADAWGTIVAAREQERASAQAQMLQAAQIINPLVAQDQKLQPWLRRANRVLLPSALVFGGGVFLMSAAPAIGIGLAIAGGLAAAASGAFRFKLASQHGAIMSAYLPANARYQQAQGQANRVQQDVDYARPRAEAAASRIQSLEGDLQIHRMADAVNHATPPAQKLTVGEHAIQIGHLTIPRRAEPEEEAVSAAG